MKLKKLDRYFLKEFYRWLILMLAAVIMLFIIVNFFETLDKFVDKKPAIVSIFRYYLFQIPYLFVLLLPMAHLLASFFSVGEMARRLEILAIKASGINLYRIVATLSFAGLVNSGVSFAVGEFLTPAANKKFRYVKTVEIEKKKSPYRRIFAKNLSFFGRSGYLYFFKYISSRNNKGIGPIVMKVRSGKVVQRIDAREGYYRDSLWVFKDVTVRNFLNGEVRVKFYSEKEFPELKESPFQLLKEQYRLDEMSIFELKRQLEMLRSAGLDYMKILAEIHVRIAFPFANFVILFFSLPLAMSMRGRGRALGFGLSVLLSFIYWGILQSSRIMGQLGKIDPLIAAWIPNILFFIPGLYFMLKLRR